MKKTLVSFLFSSMFFGLMAQPAHYSNVTDLYDAAQYDKCIEKAVKASDKNTQEPEPWLYMGLCNFQQSKPLTKQAKGNMLKDALKNTYKARQKDRNNELFPNHEAVLNEMKDSVLEYANTLFYDKKEQPNSYFYYDYVAKIYGDTTVEFRFLLQPLNERNDTLFFILNSDTINRTDMDGLKQGTWIKVYPNGRPAYHVYFVDDEPRGDFVRYNEGGGVYVRMRYTQGSTYVPATFFYMNGSKMSAGYYDGKLKDSLWNYFAEDGRMVMEERFSQGLKNGATRVYHLNGRVMEETSWVNDVQTGVWRKYYDTGTVQFESMLKEGVRSGGVRTYHPNGIVEMSGNYLNNNREGVWEFFDMDGKKLQSIEYKNGLPTNPDLIIEKETQELLDMDKQRGVIKDPQDFINNPDLYNGGN